MLISVLNIELTCDWHKAIKLNYKNTRTNVIVVLRVTSTIHEKAQRWRNMADCAKRHAGTVNTAFTLKDASIVRWRISCAGCSIWNRKKPPLFSGHYLRNRSTLDIGVLILYRYTLTQGAPSRSLGYSSWDTVYARVCVLCTCFCL